MHRAHTSRYSKAKSIHGRARDRASTDSVPCDGNQSCNTPARTRTGMIARTGLQRQSRFRPGRRRRPWRRSRLPRGPCGVRRGGGSALPARSSSAQQALAVLPVSATIDTRAHKRTNARAHSLTHTHSQMHTHTRTNTHTHRQARTHENSRAGAHTHTHTHNTQ